MTWTQYIRQQLRRLAATLRRAAREISYGVDTYNAISHGIDPEPRRR